APTAAAPGHGDSPLRAPHLRVWVRPRVRPWGRAPLEVLLQSPRSTQGRLTRGTAGARLTQRSRGSRELAICKRFRSESLRDEARLLKGAQGARRERAGGARR
ncbi:hypothetical protein DV515_00002939, partial [Chloebia gouldiae]